MTRSHQSTAFRPVAWVDKAKDLWRAVRGEGQVLIGGSLSMSGSHWVLNCDQDLQSPENVARAVDLFQRGLSELERLDSPTARDLLAIAKSRRNNWRVVFTAGGGRAIEVPDQSEESLPLRLNADLPDAMGDSSGAPTLVMLNWVYAMSRSVGDDHKTALHRVLSVYDTLKTPEHGHERRQLLELLHSEKIDSEDLFATFLESGTDDSEVILRAGAQLKELPGLDLFGLRILNFNALQDLQHALWQALLEAETTGNTASARERLANLDFGLVLSNHTHLLDPWIQEVEWIKSNLQREEGRKRLKALKELLEIRYRWRDNAIVTATGQSMIDLPWSRARVRSLLGAQFENEDDRRKAISEEINAAKDVDRANLDAENVRRLGEMARERGIPLFVVRLGRAGHNQGLYAAASRVIEVDDHLRRAARRLEKSAGDEAQLSSVTNELLELVYRNRPTPNPHFEGRLEAFLKQARLLRDTKLAQLESQRRQLLRDGRLTTSAKRTLNEGARQIQSQYEAREASVRHMEEAIAAAPQSPNAMVVYLFRPSPNQTSVSGASIMEGGDPYPGKTEELKDLKRYGGDMTFATTSLEALRYATDVLEAPTLFIKEKVDEASHKKTVEVDQADFELLFRSVAPYIALNNQDSLDGDYVSLAREQLVRENGALAQRFDELVTDFRAHQRRDPRPDERDEIFRAIVREAGLAEPAARLAAVIALTHRQLAMEVEHYLEEHKAENPRVFEALRAVLIGHPDSLYRRSLAAADASTNRVWEKALELTEAPDRDRLDAVYARLAPSALKRNRQLPGYDEFLNYMTMTTMGPGLTEALPQRWIHEEVTLDNVVRDQGWDQDVAQRIQDYRTRMTALGEKVVRQYGKWSEVEALIAAGIRPQRAILDIAEVYGALKRELSTLAVLAEWEEKSGQRPYDPSHRTEPALAVEALRQSLGGYADETGLFDPKELLQKNYKNELILETAKKVIEHNFTVEEWAVKSAAMGSPDPETARRDAILDDASYLADFHAMILSAAREKALALAQKEVDRLLAPPADAPGEAVQISLNDIQDAYWRDHTKLASTMAKREVIARKGLALAGNPYYHPNFMDMPHDSSRVDLGSKEAQSVYVWAQWGGTQHARTVPRLERILQGMNQNVFVRRGQRRDEMLKMVDNAYRNMAFSASNAFALIVQAIKEGDMEEIIDQINFRGEDLLPPPGAGYGGYCIPKDLFYLKLSLYLDNKTLLRKQGVPKYLHEPLIDFARRIYLARSTFEYRADWVRWADEELTKDPALNRIFGLYGESITVGSAAVAETLANTAELAMYRTADVLIDKLAARYGVDKMIVNSEEFLRFLVFFSTWLWVRKMGPDLRGKVLALMPNYKGSTEETLSEDIRYSTAMRMFEIFSGTYEYLTESMDVKGSLLAHVLVEGLDPNNSEEKNQTRLKEFCRLFDLENVPANQLPVIPPLGTPGDIKIFSPLHKTTHTGATKGNIYDYVGETPLKGGVIGQEVLAELQSLGFRPNEIEANIKVFGGDLARWHVPASIPASHWKAFKEKDKGLIHAAVLEVRDIDRDIENWLTGIDSIHVSSPYPDLWRLLQHPSKLKFLMQRGRPNSALHIFDAPAGRRIRALGQFDVMRWMAHGGTYETIGVGPDTLERWRERMERNRSQTRVLVSHLENGDFDAADALFARIRDERLPDDMKELHYEEQRLLRLKIWNLRGVVPHAMQTVLSEVYKGRVRLADLKGPQLKAVIAALGGMYFLDGEDPAKIGRLFERLDVQMGNYRRLRRAQVDSRVSKVLSDAAAQAAWDVLVQPRYFPPEAQKAAALGAISSVKATQEEVPSRTLGRRKEDEKRARQQRLDETQRTAYLEVTGRTFDSADAALDAARSTRDELFAILQGTGLEQAEDPDATRATLYRLQGTFVGLMQKALELTALTSVHDPAFQKELVTGIRQLSTDGQLNPKAWEAFYGKERKLGLFTRMIDDHISPPSHPDRTGRRLQSLMPLIDVMHTALALRYLMPFAAEAPKDIDPVKYQIARADFMSETVNDHFMDHLPWLFHRSRAFMDFFKSVHATPDSDLSSSDRLAKRVAETYDTIFNADGRQIAFAWASQSHAWLGTFLTHLDTTRSILKDLPLADREQLTGSYDSVDSGVAAIGAAGESPAETRWLDYVQKTAPVRLQVAGFAVPEVFDAFDPDVIDAGHRVNLLYEFPNERPHVQGFVREGPAVNQELIHAGEPGVNILIGRRGSWIAEDYAGHKAQMKPAYGVTDAYVYLTRDQYIDALVRCKGLTVGEAEARAVAKLEGSAKPYIYAAVRFKVQGKDAPVAAIPIPLHGDRRYVMGEFEANGIPMLHGSRLQILDSYDKWRTATDTDGLIRQPDQIVWKPEYYTPLRDYFTTKRGLSDEADLAIAIQKVILEGPLADGYDEVVKLLIEQAGDKPYPGIRAFAEKNRVLILPAAQPGNQVITKPAAGSGSRGMDVYMVAKHRPDGTFELDNSVLQDVAQAMFDLGKADKILLANVWSLPPELVMSEAYMQWLERQQVLSGHDMRRDVDRIYSSMRIIMSTDQASAKNHPGKWHEHHPIITSSRNLVTNEARGGTFAMFLPEFAAAGQYEAIRHAMHEGGREATESTVISATRVAEELGVEPGHDLTGASYAHPWWKMIDLWIMPQLSETGRFLYSEPQLDKDGHRTGTTVYLEHKTEHGPERIRAEVTGVYPVLIEKNDGIGQVLQVNRFEEKTEKDAAKREGRPLNPEAIGVNDRIALTNFARGMRRYYTANFGPDYFGPGGDGSRPKPGGFPETNALGRATEQARRALGDSFSGRDIGTIAKYYLIDQLEGRGYSKGMNLMDAGTQARFLTEMQIFYSAMSWPEPPNEKIPVDEREFLIWQGDSFNVRTVMCQVFDYFTGVDQGIPEIRTLPAAMKLEELREQLKERPVHAVVYNTPVGIGKDLWWWTEQADRHTPEQPQANRYAVVDVNVEGIDPATGLIHRLRFWDEETQAWMEVSLEEPLRPDRVQILALQQPDERAEHARLSQIFEQNGIPVLNPTTLSETVDSKTETSRILREAGVAVPLDAELTGTVKRLESFEDELTHALTHLAEETGRRGRSQTLAIMIQPDHGTEGQGVERFEITFRKRGETIRIFKNNAFRQALSHLVGIFEAGERAVVRLAWEGNVDIRVYAFPGKSDDESTVVGYGMEAPEGETITSAGREGRGRIPLHEALEVMRISAEEARATAVQAARSLGLSAASFDLRRAPDGKLGVIDAHSRLVGVQAAQPLTPEDAKPMPFFSASASRPAAFKWKEFAWPLAAAALLLWNHPGLLVSVVLGIAAVHIAGHHLAVFAFKRHWARHLFNRHFLSHGIFEDAFDLSPQQQAVFEVAGPLANFVAALVTGLATHFFFGGLSEHPAAQIFIYLNALLGGITLMREARSLLSLAGRYLSERFPRLWRFTGEPVWIQNQPGKEIIRQGLMKGDINRRDLTEFADALRREISDIGQYLREHHVDLLTSYRKEDGSIVTQGDHYAQDRLIRFVMQNAPVGARLVFEEKIDDMTLAHQVAEWNEKNNSSPWVIAIDPIDGTVQWEGYGRAPKPREADSTRWMAGATALYYKGIPVLAMAHAPEFEIPGAAPWPQSGSFFEAFLFNERTLLNGQEMNVAIATRLSDQNIIMEEFLRGNGDIGGWGYLQPNWREELFPAIDVHRVDTRQQSSWLTAGLVSASGAFSSLHLPTLITFAAKKTVDVGGYFFIAKAGGSVLSADGEDVFPLSKETLAAGDGKTHSLVGGCPAIAEQFVDAYQKSRPETRERLLETVWARSMKASAVPSDALPVRPAASYWSANRYPDESTWKGAARTALSLVQDKKATAEKLLYLMPLDNAGELGTSKRYWNTTRRSQPVTVDVSYGYPNDYRSTFMDPGDEALRGYSNEEQEVVLRMAGKALESLNLGYGPEEKLPFARVVLHVARDNDGFPLVWVHDLSTRPVSRPVQPLRESLIPMYAMRIVREGLDEDLNGLFFSIRDPDTVVTLLKELHDYLALKSEENSDPLLLLRQERAIMAVGDLLWQFRHRLTLNELPDLLEVLSSDITTRVSIAGVVFKRDLRFGNEEDYLSFINQFVKAANEREMAYFQLAARKIRRDRPQELRFRYSPTASRFLKIRTEGPQRAGISSANAADNQTSANERGSPVLNFAINLDGTTPITVEIERLDRNVVALETHDNLVATEFPKEKIFEAGNVKEFFTTSSQDAANPFHKDDPLMLLKYTLIFSGIVHPEQDNCADYRATPEKILEDIARFTHGGGLRVKLVNHGPSRSGFASSSSVSLALLKAAYKASRQDDLADDPTKLADIALLMENALGFKSGAQDVHGPGFAGVKSYVYKKTSGLLHPAILETGRSGVRRLADIEKTLPEHLVLVDTGIQRPAATNDLSRGLNMRHLSYLSRDPERFLAVRRSYGIHYMIEQALEARNWERLGRMDRSYMALRTTIDPGAVQSSVKDTNGNVILLQLFNQLEKEGLIYGGMFTGAMGGGVAMLIPTPAGQKKNLKWNWQRKWAPRLVSRLDQALWGIKNKNFLIEVGSGSKAEQRPFAKLQRIQYAVNSKGPVFRTAIRWPSLSWRNATAMVFLGMSFLPLLAEVARGFTHSIPASKIHQPRLALTAA